MAKIQSDGIKKFALNLIKITLDQIRPEQHCQNLLVR